LITLNPSYNPIVDVLNFSLLPETIGQPNDIFLSDALFPSAKVWQDSNTAPDGTTFGSVGGPALYFQPNDRPFILSAAIFANFADGLIFQPADQGNNLLDLACIYAPFADLDGGPAPAQPNNFSIPALNTWFDVNTWMSELTILSGGLTGSAVPYLVPYITFGIVSASIGMHFLTTLIDPALNGQKVFFQIKIKVAHTFPMQNSFGGKSL
jgi:hypothetical protein